MDGSSHSCTAAKCGKDVTVNFRMVTFHICLFNDPVLIRLQFPMASMFLLEDLSVLVNSEVYVVDVYSVSHDFAFQF